MTVRVLFFGVTAEMAGTRATEMDVSPKTTAHAILNDVLESFPAMYSHKLNISINQHYAAGDEIVCDGDELAIFTAVSGG